MQMLHQQINLDYIKNLELVFSVMPNNINKLIISYCDKCIFCNYNISDHVGDSCNKCTDGIDEIYEKFYKKCLNTCRGRNSCLDDLGFYCNICIKDVILNSNSYKMGVKLVDYDYMIRELYSENYKKRHVYIPGSKEYYKHSCRGIYDCFSKCGVYCDICIKVVNIIMCI